MTTPNSHEPLETFGKGIVEIDVSFAPNGSGAVDATSVKGAFVASVARAAQGSFTVTFEDGFKPVAFLGGSAYVHDASNLATRVAKIGLVDDQASPVTAKIYVTDLATPTLQDVAAAAASVVKACLKFKMSPVKDSSGYGGI